MDRLGPSDLADPESFRSWVARLLGDASLASIVLGEAVVLDSFSRFRLASAVEAVIGSPFPDDLLEAMVSIDDWYYFTMIRHEHSRSGAL